MTDPPVDAAIDPAVDTAGITDAAVVAWPGELLSVLLIRHSHATRRAKRSPGPSTHAAFPH
jgi:hypothetical protein